MNSVVTTYFLASIISVASLSAPAFGNDAELKQFPKYGFSIRLKTDYIIREVDTGIHGPPSHLILSSVAHKIADISVGSSSDRVRWMGEESTVLLKKSGLEFRLQKKEFIPNQVPSVIQRSIIVIYQGQQIWPNAIRFTTLGLSEEEFELVSSIIFSLEAIPVVESPGSSFPF